MLIMESGLHRALWKAGLRKNTTGDVRGAAGARNWEVV